METAVKSALELFMIIVLVYLYTREPEFIEWEQKQKKKLCRFIYRKITAYEQKHKTV